MIEEMEALVQRGVSLDGNLYISKNAHLIMPYHPALDRASESKAGKRRIGTTGKGVGPAYADKAARIGIRMADLLDQRLFREKLEYNVDPEEPHPARDLRRRDVLGRGHPRPLPPVRRVAGALHHRYRAAPVAVDRRRPLRALRGRPGHHARPRPRDLSLHHLVQHHRGRAPARAAASRRPRSTAASASPRPIAPGSAAGPFPTELHGETADLLRARGNEYGAVTGRPRRCGWADAVGLRYAVRINGMDTLAITKLDVLDACETVKVCTGYRVPGRPPHRVPRGGADLARGRARVRGAFGLADLHPGSARVRRAARPRRASTSSASPS